MSSSIPQNPGGAKVGAKVDTSRGAGPRIGLICLSAIPDDPRVRRQGDIFHDSGFAVVGVGLPGFRSGPVRWSYRSQENAVPELDEPAGAAAATPRDISGQGGMRARLAQIPGLRPLARRLRQIRRALDLVILYFRASVAFEIYWRLNDKFTTLYRIAAAQKVDLWLANDWTTLPIVMRLARETGVPFLYDTHELAVDEYAQNLKWRLTQRPIIAAIEGAGIHAAASTCCVSGGIADRLQQFHRLPIRPFVVRNTPLYAQAAFRPTGERIGVLYHGIVAPGRGLEESIASVAGWRPEFHLTIRGPSDPTYLAQLKSQAEAAGVAARVVFAPPVAMVDLVASARDHDVGLFAIRGHSLQNTYVLPNKFFEYTMAGLALCVSDLPEMRRLVDEYTLGELIAEVTPDAIARAVNALDRDRIDSFKRQALKAARTLCWEHEGATLIEMARAALGKPGADPAEHRLAGS